jgi:hypothetical protein
VMGVTEQEHTVSMLAFAMQKFTCLQSNAHAWPAGGSSLGSRRAGNRAGIPVARTVM